ncbi:MAG TPA: DUF2059 domain-containing protein [Pyrinomonadaceae bacterium]|jgi:hypothetical protein
MKRILLIVTLIACAGLSTTAHGQAGVAPEKAENIRRLMEITGSHNLGLQMIEQMMATLKNSMPADNPKLRDKIFSIYETEMQKVFTVEKVNELIIPIYDKHLTNEEVVALIAFYESPLGRKIVGVLPQIYSEASVAGQQLGREANERAMARIRSEVFPESDAAPNPPPPAKRRPARRPRT